MTMVLAVFSGVLTVLLGRLMFSRWFNHVGLYGLVWSSSLALFHSGLIRYYPVESETWFIVAASWIAFTLGSGVVVAMRYSVRQGDPRVERTSASTQPVSLSVLTKILWVMNVIAILDVVYEVYNVSRLLGGVRNILALGNLLYSIRVHEGIPGTIPYVATISSVGCLLAGYYTSVLGRLRLVAVIPILAAIMNSITNMVRATLIIAAILFVVGFLVGKRKLLRESPQRLSKLFRRLVIVVVVIALIVSAMELIRETRGITESFAGSTTTLNKLNTGRGSFVTPSIFFYVTAEYGVLNQYLKKDIEHYPTGHYSFAPLWRVLSKLGFETYVQQHSIFYLTPVNANTGSYLRELHSDFGIAGIVVGPFLLGLIASVFWFRLMRTQSLMDLVIVGHIFVGVGMSIFTFAPQMGVWVGSLIFGLVISFLASNRTHLQIRQLRIVR